MDELKKTYLDIYLFFPFNDNEDMDGTFFPFLVKSVLDIVQIAFHSEARFRRRAFHEPNFVRIWIDQN